MTVDELMGSRVTFCPASFCEHGYVEENAPRAKGVVVAVNKKYHTFTVKYPMGGREFLETFNFAQLGGEVTVCGK